MSIQVSHEGRALVVSMFEDADVALVDCLADALDAVAEAAPVVVDLSAVTLAPRGGVEALIQRLTASAASTPPGHYALVATRLTARRLLRQLGVGGSLPLFPTVGAAVAALITDRVEVGERGRP